MPSAWLVKLSKNNETIIVNRGKNSLGPDSAKRIRKSPRSWIFCIVFLVGLLAFVVNIGIYTDDRS
jgi:hypothetical protein